MFGRFSLCRRRVSSGLSLFLSQEGGGGCDENLGKAGRVVNAGICVSYGRESFFSVRVSYEYSSRTISTIIAAIVFARQNAVSPSGPLGLLAPPSFLPYCPIACTLSPYLSPQVTLKNDMPRPLHVALSRKIQRQPKTVLPVDSEVCVPFPLLRDEALRFWRSPRALVGGDALKRALEEESKRNSGRGWLDRTLAGGRRGDKGEEEKDAGEEVSVDITPKMFDRTKKVVERHSKRYRLVDTLAPFRFALSILCCLCLSAPWLSGG